VAVTNGADAARLSRRFANAALGVWVIATVAVVATTGWSLYPTWLAVGTPIVFGMFAFDKRQARRGNWRVSEGALLGLVIGGGVLGGWLGMLTLRHKTRHTSFWATLAVASGVHIALLVAGIVR
jgi:uncharacterized membrane protein YsdA (DUF1294 family)